MKTDFSDKLPLNSALTFWGEDRLPENIYSNSQVYTLYRRANNHARPMHTSDIAHV